MRKTAEEKNCLKNSSAVCWTVWSEMSGSIADTRASIVANILKMVNRFHIGRVNPPVSLTAKKMNESRANEKKNTMTLMRRNWGFFNDMDG